MKNFLEKLKLALSSPRSTPWFLLGVSLLTYGLFFWARGFYWDEAPWTWIYYRLGPAALTQTFSTSRPFWGMIYQITMPIIGAYPWRWQLLMAIMRWLTAVLVWAVLRQVWPQNPRPALWASLLFLVYPGLGQNFISLMYTHFYIVLNCLLLSFYFSLLALRNPARKIPLSLIAILLAFINLITLEYFYFIEFFRIFLFWFSINGEWKEKIRRVALLSAPYLFLISSVSIWRLFFFKNQNASYGYANLHLIQQNTWQGTLKVIGDILSAFWETVPHAWLFPFQPVDIATLGLRTGTVAAAVSLISIIAIGMYVFLFVRPAKPDQMWRNQALILGLAGWLFAGGSFWLVGIQPLLHFSSDRFAMPFMLGSSLIVAGLLGFLEARPKVQYVALALLVGLSIGKQFQTNISYVRDWDVQRGLFWQMSWRIPSLAPGTALIANDFPVTYFSDNSLSGLFNWIYSPPGKMDHILYFASVRVGRVIPEIKPNIPFEQFYPGTTFYGNTSRMVAINYSPPGCLRVLDPEIEGNNKLLPPLMRDVSSLSDISLIETDSSVSLPASLYGPEPAHGWCYYFEKADLARQMGDWSRVVELGDGAFALNDYPNDPIERFVFIEGYAHQGNWTRAKELAIQSYKVSPNFVGPLLCRLLSRMDRQIPNSDQKVISLNDLRTKFSCLP